MNEQGSPTQPADPHRSSPSPSPSAPYEAILGKAFDKLTSQVFIFLLAYLILIIGLGVIAPEMTTELRTLIHVLPVLGIGAYVWQRQQSIVKQAREQGINVKAGIVGGEAQVVGEQSATDSAGMPTNIDLGVGMALGKAQVKGRVFGEETSSAKPTPTDEQHLVDLYHQLDDDSRSDLIITAMQMAKQGKRHRD